MTTPKEEFLARLNRAIPDDANTFKASIRYDTRNLPPINFEGDNISATKTRWLCTGEMQVNLEIAS